MATSKNNPVNTQITDAVTQSNVKVLTESPAMAMGNVYQTCAHSLGLLYENSINAQSQSAIAAIAISTQAAVTLFTSVEGSKTSEIDIKNLGLMHKDNLS